MPVTPLSLYGTRAQSSIIPTANTLSSATGGSAASSNTTIGMHFGYGEVQSQGTSLSWPELLAPAAPSGYGWIKDLPLLEGNRIIVGLWSASLQMMVSADGTTLTTDMFLRFYKRSQAGSYTAIGILSLLAQTVTETLTTYVFPASNLNAVSFGSGDRLYIDLPLNILANSSTFSSTMLTTTMGMASLGVGNSIQFTTPGYTINPRDDLSMRLVLLDAVSRTDVATRVCLGAIGMQNISSRLLFGTAYSELIMGDSPYVYYRLGDKSGTIARDETFHRYDGVISGGVTLGQPGPIIGDNNTAMLFNGGADIITLPSVIRPETWTTFSFECWFNLSTAAFTSFPTLFGNESPYDHAKGFNILLNSGASSAEVDVSNGSGFSSAFTSALSASTWYHLVGTYDGSTLRSYVNGVFATSISFSGPMAISTYPVTIGALITFAGDPSFPGRIAEVALYTHTLSAAQVLAHYRAAGYSTLDLSTRLYLS